jgi:tetratricopeptide (TPR) repeat protein
MTPFSLGKMPNGTQVLNSESRRAVKPTRFEVECGAVELAERFRDLRIQAGLTKTALAKPSYTVSYVSQIEAGRRRPSPQALQFFSDRLGVSPHFLSTGIPEGIEEHLRYRLEEARHAIRGGDAEEADRVLRSLLEQAERYGLHRLRTRALVAAGDTRMLSARVREAIDSYEEALEGDVPTHDRALAVAGLGRAYRTVGDLAYAAEVVESFLNGRELVQPLDPTVAADLQAVLVSIYFERGDVLRAERAARRALSVADLGAPVDVRAKAYWDASRVMAESKQWEEALDLATRARVLMEQIDDRRQVGRLHNAFAFLCLEADPPRTTEAASHLDRAQDLLLESGAAGDLAYVFTERSRLALLEQRFDSALHDANQALAQIGADELEAARCRFLKGRALAALDRREEARRELEEAAALFEKGGARQQQASCWRELGELDLAAGDVDSAVQSLRAGLEALDPRRSRA